MLRNTCLILFLCSLSHNLFTSALPPQSSGRQLSRQKRQFSEILDIIGIVSGGLTDNNLRHPASGGKCIDIAGASPSEWTQVILYPCTRTLGLAPVNQRFSFIEGKDNNVLIRAAFNSLSRCFIAPRRDGDRQVYSAGCNRDVQDMNWRVDKVDGSKIMIRHIPSNQCLKPENDKIQLGNCDSSDEWTKWVVCKASDDNCGK